MPARHARSTSAVGSHRPSDAVVCRCRSITLGVRAPATFDRLHRPATPFARDEALVLADEQLEMLLLLFGKLHEYLFAFGVFEPLAVLFEEAMRPALALDADEQRLLIVDALAQTIGAFCEKAICGAFEEEKRRPRLELRIHFHQLRVSVLERAEVFLL